MAILLFITVCEILFSIVNRSYFKQIYNYTLLYIVLLLLFLSHVQYDFRKDKSKIDAD